MRPRSIVTATLLASVALAAPAQAATVSPKGVRFARLAVNADGATIVAWERLVKGAIAVEVRTGASAGKLGRTLRLASPARDPRVAIGADGTRAVQWLEETARGGVRSIRVAIARPGHGFGKGRLLDRRHANMGTSDLAVQPNGRVVAIWRRTSTALGYALAPRGHGFGKARDLTRTGSIGMSSIALDARDGAVVLAYGTPLQTAPITNTQAGARTLTTAATAFSEPTVISDPAGLAEAVGVAVTGSGGAGVAYTQTATSRFLRLARRKADGTWSAPELVANPVYGENVFAIGLAATLPTDGSALATWTIDTQAGGLGGSIAKQTVASLAPAAGRFGAPVALTPPDGRYAATAIASAGAEAFLATAQAHGPVLLATRPAGGTALRTRTVTVDGDGDVALAAAGTHVLLAYQRDDRLRLHTVR